MKEQKTDWITTEQNGETDSCQRVKRMHWFDWNVE